MAHQMSESAILIINDPQSAVEILKVINQYSRIFAQHPIRILRGDNARDHGAIATLTKQFQIKSVPALITRDNNVTIGKAKIYSFLPQLAHAINNAEQQQAKRMILWDDDTFREHQLQQSLEMDQHGETDDQPDSAEEMSRRVAQYKQAMEQRNACLLQSEAERAAAAGASASVAAPKPVAKPSDKMAPTAPHVVKRAPAGQRASPMQQVPMTPVRAPPAGRQVAPVAPGQPMTAASKVLASDDPFDRRFAEMMEETAMPVVMQQ